MQTVLSNVPDPDLRAYVVWVPTLRGDNQQQAAIRSGEFDDSRVRYFWDEQMITGDAWRDALGINRETAWDVYFLFDDEAVWNLSLPVPEFWMHQLGGVDQAPKLNRKTFEERVKSFLSEKDR